MVKSIVKGIKNVFFHIENNLYSKLFIFIYNNPFGINEG